MEPKTWELMSLVEGARDCLKRAAAMAEAKCKWEYELGEHYVECTNKCIATGESIAENGFRYCPFCRGEIEEVLIEDDGDCPDDYPAFDAWQLFG